MGSYSDKLRKRNHNLPRRGSYIPPERKKRGQKPIALSKNALEIRKAGGIKPSDSKPAETKPVAEADLKSEGIKDGAPDISGLQFSRNRKGRSSPKARRLARLRVTAPAVSVSEKLHQEIRRKDDDQNSGAEAADTGIKAVAAIEESAAALTENHYYGNKLKDSLGKTAAAKEGEAGGPGVRLSFSDEITDYELSEKEDGRLTGKRRKKRTTGSGFLSNPASRDHQRKGIRQWYAAAIRNETVSAGSAKEEAAGARLFAARLKNTASKFGKYLKNRARFLVIGGVMALVLAAIIGGTSSCSVVLGGGGNGVIAVSYTAEDEDILGVEEDYKTLENKLRERIASVESELPDFDEYVYNVSEIGHNPYEMASLMTILFEAYHRDDEEVQGMLQKVFDWQYEFSLEPRTEIRTRDVEKTGEREILNEVTGEIETEEYTYTETEEFEYRILTVNMFNHQLRRAVDELELTEDQLKRYEIILSLRGNRTYLFGGDIYANTEADGDGTPQNPYLDFRVPGEALTDQKFARMLQVAKRYLGHEYVWGGSSFEEGFDCSGYVCWVINESGVGHIDRTTVNGIMKWTTPIPASERKPGDIVYFQGTYDTPGASHVGIYVGGGMMIHTGNPCKFSSIDSGYFANHMLGYGRIPEN